MRIVRIAVLLIVAASCAGADESTHYDTIVVGLGAAGTTAASELARAGRRVLALEAQGRAGGRVWTRHFGDGIIEFGAEWIHGTERSPTYGLALSSNVSVAEQQYQLQLLQAGGERWSAEVQDLIDTGTEYVLSNDVEETISVGDNVIRKLTAYAEEKHPTLAADAALMGQIFSFLEEIAGANGGCYSWFEADAKGTFQSLNGSQTASWGRNGYRTLFDILLNKFNNGTGLPTLDIKLNTEVTSISWTPEPRAVEVTADGRKYTADNVIVTVSLGVLKERHAAMFSPPLPAEKVSTIEKMVMGVIGKMIFSLERAWWGKDQLFGVLWTKEQVDALPEDQRWISRVYTASTSMGSSNTLTLWTSGNTTKLVESLLVNEVKTRGLELLRRFLGPNVTIPEPTGFLRTTWLSNPYTLGAYSVDTPSIASFPARATLAAPLAAPLTDSAGAPRVLFAGEATNIEHYATVHGAVESGHREAARLLGKLNE